ncbi:hypothetical protein Strain138_000139 [Pseudogemmatithrix spongiicola]|uniref:Bacterial surface antigen (D15) domain-containing protein n=1 Tax=Pseudogemmatithrix spongiicola TaxID=3062599 RepID=A0AA49JS06_9BACT|nr:hypothetical protein Strain138_000139 [Gemmatimonadaceae bacterium 'strain 138']WKW13815.1 hypothetical protein Strain318_000139 [Gemmatimonadaceae bacterium 'strain 318']
MHTIHALPRLGLALLATSAVPQPRALAQTTSVVVPTALVIPDRVQSVGAALLRVTLASDSLGTRPSSVVADVGAGVDGGWRASFALDKWQPGNRRRLTASAYVSRLTIEVFDDFEFQPERVGWELRQHWRRGAGTWLYAGLGGRKSSGGTDPYRPWGGPFCDSAGNCAAATGHDALSTVGSFWVPGTERFTALTARAGWLRDTRDNIFAPEWGRYVDFAVHAHRYGRDEWDEESYSVRLDARVYRPDAAGGVWALQGLFGLDSEKWNPIPIDESFDLPMGRYYAGGYRDQLLLFAQAEWRGPKRWMRNRLGAAAFGSVSGSHWQRAGTSATLFGAGAGLRYRLNADTRTTLRLDYAVSFIVDRYSRPRSGLHLALQEAF